MSTVKVIADDRESQAQVIETLGSHEGVEVTVQHLALGDYLLGGRLLFERKTLRDFVVSLKVGRLFDQGIRLASSPLSRALILEGVAGMGAGRARTTRWAVGQKLAAYEGEARGMFDI